MRRPLRVVLLSAAVATILASVACGAEGKDLPEKPQLILDRASLGFGQEFGSSTYIGTSPQESLLITNGGLETLTLQSATLTGDPVFSMEGPLSSTLKGNESTFIRVVFKPTAEQVYTAKITIASNAEATTDLPNPREVQVSGRGVFPPDAGP